MSDALILDIPVELSLEFVTVIGSDFLNSEWEFPDDVIDEVDRAGLRMFLINFERPDAGCIVNGAILEAKDFLAALVNKAEEFDIHLDVMARHLFVVAFCVDLANARSARQPADAVAL